MCVYVCASVSVCMCRCECMCVGVSVCMRKCECSRVSNRGGRLMLYVCVSRCVGYVSKIDQGCFRSSPDRQYYFLNKRPVDLPKVILK